MTALKGKAVDAFLRRPDRPLVLLYGPDSGVVAERAAQLLANTAPADDPLARLTIDGDALASEPTRLAEEAWTVPLFGGKRAIRVTATGRNLAPAVEPLLKEPPTEAFIVIEAGDLKPRAPLRAAFEKSEQAAAIGCYGDDARGIERLIDEEQARSGVTFSREARAALRELTGGDRLASRGELAKIVLYAHPRNEIGIEDVEAIAGDASAVALDRLLDSVGLGQLEAADRAFGQLIAEGTSPASVISALARHFRQLADLRYRIEAGATAEAAMRAARPPIFFKRQDAVRQQITRWTPDGLERASELIADGELRGRRMPELAEAITGRCVLTLARAARRG